MPPPFQIHLFVCTNRRPEGSPKGCCASRGAEEVVLAFKKQIEARGLAGLRVNKAGCLDACERGVAAVAYPEGIWYGALALGDVAQIVDQPLVEGTPVERLRMKPYDARKPRGG
jgi:(2Fe-2S) ferredoxin